MNSKMKSQRKQQRKVDAEHERRRRVICLRPLSLVYCFWSWMEWAAGHRRGMAQKLPAYAAVHFLWAIGHAQDVNIRIKAQSSGQSK